MCSDLVSRTTEDRQGPEGLTELCNIKIYHPPEK